MIMHPDTILERLYENTIGKIEYYFAKRWLDRTFGKKEYWGEFIQKSISHSEPKFNEKYKGFGNIYDQSDG